MHHLNVPVEFKAEGKKGYFEGMGSVFGNVDHEGDVIMPGAFEQIRKTKDGKLRIALYHNLQQLAGKADVEQTAEGLYVKGQLNMNLSYTPDAYECMKDGTLDAMSVGFNILPGGVSWSEDETDREVRLITKAELWEVSIVPFGMNPEALIDNVKSGAIHTVREFERHLKSIGFSAREATAIASRGFKALDGDHQPTANETFGDLKQLIATSYKFN